MKKLNRRVCESVVIVVISLFDFEINHITTFHDEETASSSDDSDRCDDLCGRLSTRSKKNSISRNLDIFSSVFKEMQTFYVDTIDADKAVTTAINAMLAELDPYTVYMPKNETEEFRSMSTGEFGGIGSYIMQRNGNVYISYHIATLRHSAPDCATAI